ncbi:SLC44A2_4_5 [Acanthosepion pharaonis]|uniref:SLC44A2_4_5 n=1 Tax=Acanthosepion pharaonis TaxID=158019 RepID=A0A812E9P2_ACAPH|nr:SLC44A2_4_5 [Sepia pharaonis]
MMRSYADHIITSVERYGLSLPDHDKWTIIIQKYFKEHCSVRIIEHSLFFSLSFLFSLTFPLFFLFFFFFFSLHKSNFTPGPAVTEIYTFFLSLFFFFFLSSSVYSSASNTVKTATGIYTFFLSLVSLLFLQTQRLVLFYPVVTFLYLSTFSFYCSLTSIIACSSSLYKKIFNIFTWHFMLLFLRLGICTQIIQTVQFFQYFERPLVLCLKWSTVRSFFSVCLVTTAEIFLFHLPSYSAFFSSDALIIFEAQYLSVFCLHHFLATTKFLSSEANLAARLLYRQPST